MIKTKLKAVFCLCIAFGSISSMAVFYSIQDLEQKLAERKHITAISRGIFDLAILSDEYLLYQEDRPLEQWNRTYLNLSDLIDDSVDEHRFLRQDFVGIKKDLRQKKILFSRLIGTYETPIFQNNPTLSQRLKNQLKSQILTKNNELIFWIDLLKKRSEEELLSSQKRLAWIIFVFILALCGSGIGVLFFIQKAIVVPFDNLNAGVNVIGEGNLDICLDSKSPDEIGELSRAFDNMALHLKEVMISRALLQNEVNHLDRVATMGTLTAALAHEINQPLAAILSNSQAGIRFLNNTEPDVREVQQALKDIVSDTKRAGDVIGRLRRMLQKDKGQSQTLKLYDVIQEIVNFVQSQIILLNATVSVEIDPKLPLVSGDRIQIQQVLLNLLINAFDAVSNMPGQHRNIGISSHIGEGETVLISVVDSGSGIENLRLKTIFEAFYTTKEKGMGVGLTISKSIIKNHGGRIWAVNRSEGGARFSFTLPIARSNMFRENGI
jgi:signal transduction histidine kinase